MERCSSYMQMAKSSSALVRTHCETQASAFSAHSAYPTTSAVPGIVITVASNPDHALLRAFAASSSPCILSASLNRAANSSLLIRSFLDRG